MFRWISECEDLGRVDVCVANAGVAENMPLLEGTAKEWRTMLDVNVVALCLCTQLSIKSMQKVRMMGALARGREILLDYVFSLSLRPERNRRRTDHPAEQSLRSPRDLQVGPALLQRHQVRRHQPPGGIQARGTVELRYSEVDGR